MGHFPIKIEYISAKRTVYPLRVEYVHRRHPLANNLPLGTLVLGLVVGAMILPQVALPLLPAGNQYGAIGTNESLFREHNGVNTDLSDAHPLPPPALTLQPPIVPPETGEPPRNGAGAVSNTPPNAEHVEEVLGASDESREEERLGLEIEIAALREEIVLLRARIERVKNKSLESVVAFNQNCGVWASECATPYAQTLEEDNVAYAELTKELTRLTMLLRQKEERWSELRS